MERIKEKQARAGAAPTVEEKATLLATARVPEVMDILKAMRSKGESKALGEVVDLVRGSIKRPISKSEAEEAIRILGKREGNWLEIRQVGGVAAVVFKKDLAAKRFI